MASRMALHSCCTEVRRPSTPRTPCCSTSNAMTSVNSRMRCRSDSLQSWDAESPGLLYLCSASNSKAQCLLPAPAKPHLLLLLPLSVRPRALLLSSLDQRAAAASATAWQHSVMSCAAVASCSWEALEAVRMSCTVCPTSEQWFRKAFTARTDASSTHWKSWPDRRCKRSAALGGSVLGDIERWLASRCEESPGVASGSSTSKQLSITWLHPLKGTAFIWQQTKSNTDAAQ